MRKIILYLTVLFFLICFINYTSLAAGELPGLQTFTLPQLQADFKQIEEIIIKKHPKLYTDSGLEISLSEQYQKIKENMNELEFFRVLAPAVSKLNCGHTGLRFSAGFDSYLADNGRYLPLRVKIIENRIYVWQNFSNQNVPVGSEILAINGKPVPQIIEGLLPNITTDGSNLTKKYYELNHWFSESYLNYIDAPNEFHLSILKPGTFRARNITLGAVSKIKYGQMITESTVVNELDSLPYFSRITGNYGYLKIQSFGFYNSAQRNSFKSFINEFFQKLEESKNVNLILDLRDNWGGDPYCSSYLFQYLIQKPSPYFAVDSPHYEDLKAPLKPAVNRFQGNLYILINGASFSSTGHLCSLLKFYKIGTFIGEETGGSFICTDGSRDVILKNTGLRFHYSTMAFKTAVSGLTPGRGIMPNYQVVPTIDDYIAGKDVEKEFAVGLIEAANP